MSEQKPNLDSLFEEAAKIESQDERSAFLEQSCGDDVALRQQVEQLLISDQQAGSFLEEPPIGLEATISNEGSGEDRAASLEAGLTSAFSSDEAVVVGDQNHSVLKMLGQTLGSVPRVALRDPAAEGDDPIAKPNSPEIPHSDSDGRYRLDGEIARGGMGAIIKGRDTDLGRDLVIKVLLDAHKDKPEVIQRFVEEAQIGGQLQHPGIAPIYELGQFADQRPFFAMKLVKGETLAKLLADREETTDERGKLIGIFEQICQTMAYAHSRGVIHRDLKPANIMVGAFGEVQVMDWGLAKVLSTGGVADEMKAKQTQQGQSIIQTIRSTGSDVPGSDGSVGTDTQMGSVMGTPAYMPPEQALGEIDLLDERADVFGLGAILCEILTGKPPYVADNGTQVFRLASRGKLDDAFTRLENCAADEDMISLTRHCLELERTDRPRDAGVLAQRVTSYLESVESKLREAEVERAAEAARADESGKRARMTIALAASMLLALTLGGGGWMVVRQQAATHLAAATSNLNDRLSDARLHQQLAAVADLSNDEGLFERARELSVALESARDAVKLTEAAEIPSTLREASVELLASLETEYSVAEQAANNAAANREFKQELELIRVSRAAAGKSKREKPSRPRSSYGQVDGLMVDLDGFAQEDFSELYREAFRKAGLDLASRTDEEAVRWIQESAIKETLIAAIDDWIRAELSANGSSATDDSGDVISTNRLQRLVDKADYSDWRKQLRAALTAEDVGKLKELASADEARLQQPALLAWLGRSLREESALEEAIRVLSDAQARYPGDLELNLGLGWALHMTNDRKVDGLGYLRAAVAVRPESLVALTSLSSGLNSLERYDESIELSHRVVELDPKYARAHFVLGISLQEQGKLVESIAANRQAIELNPKYAEAHVNLGIGLYYQGKLNESITAYRRAIDVNPELLQAHLNLGIALLNQGKLDESIAEFREAMKLEPTNVIAHHNLGVALKNQGKLDEAIAKFREVIELDPKYTNAHVNLGNLLLNQGKLNEAIAEFRQAIELDSTQAAAHINLGNALTGQGKLDEAIAEYRTAIELDPNDAGPHINLGVALGQQGKLDEAIAELRKVIELDPTQAAAHMNLGICFSIQAKLDEAIAAHRKAIELDPNDAGPHINLGDTLQKQGKLEEAIAELRTAIEIDPKIALPHIKLFDTLKKQGKLDEAIAELRTAIELDPESALAHSKLGAYLSNQGKLDEAIAEIRTTIELDPENAIAHANLGKTLVKLGKPDEAIAACRVAIKLDPENAAAHDGLGWVLGQQGKLNEAIAEYRVAIKLDPENARAHVNLGSVLDQQGKLDEAIAEFREAIELDPKHAFPHHNLGVVLRKLGKLDEAIVKFRQAIELDPKYTVAHNKLSDALMKQGKPDEAIKALREAIELNPKNAPIHKTLGWVLGQQGKPDEEIAAYRQAIEVDPTFALAHNSLGWALGQQGKLDEAIAEFRKAIALDPTSAKAYSNLANALKQQGKTDEAIAVYRKAIEVRPNDLAHSNQIAFQLMNMNQLDESLAVLRGVIELDPKNAEAYVRIGDVLERKNMLEEAAASHRKAIEIDPKFAFGHINLGGILGKQGKAEEAIAEMRLGIELASESSGWQLPYGHRMLGDFLLEQSKVDEAIAEYRKAIELNSKDAESLNNLAWLLATTADKNGQYPHAQEAVKLSRRANELATNNPGFWLNTLGVALYRAEQYQEAIGTLQRSTELGFDLPINWLFIAMAHWQLDEKSKALQWYEKSLAWKEDNQADVELQGFYAEAAKLMAPGNSEGLNSKEAAEAPLETKSKTGSDKTPDSEKGKQ